MFDINMTYIGEAKTRYYWKNSKDYMAWGTGISKDAYASTYCGGGILEDVAEDKIRKKAEACDLL